jgi:preprotein translocase subunit SecG
MHGFFTFLLIVQALVALALITLILMQRSEGGGLAGGGSPAGMMSARGASDFLTRGTAILATIFVAMSIVLAALAAHQRGGNTIDASLARPVPAAPTPAAPLGVPGGAPASGTAAPAAPLTGPAPAAQPPAQTNQSGVPLAQ